MIFGTAGLPWLKQLGAALFFLGAAWPLCANQPSAGTEPAPGIKGSSVGGIGGYYRIGRCTPVTIRLENSGRDLEGRIQIRISGDLYTQAVSLPSPSQKKLVMYVVPQEDLDELEIYLYSKGVQVKKFAPEIQRLSDEQILTIVSSSLESHALSNDDFPEQESREKIVFMDPGDLPESWKDYDAVNAVILSVSDATGLSSRQRKALSQWTLLGGRVNLVDRNMANVENPFGTGSGTRSDANPSGFTSPRTSHGMGTFGTTDRSNGILFADESAFTGYRSSIPDLDREIFHSARVRDPFSRTYILWYVGLFLLLYTAAVALWLTNFRKSRWIKSWKLATIPALALLFSFLSPWIGRTVNAGDTGIQQRSVIHVFANNADSFAINDYILLFPRQAQYRFDSAFSSALLVQAESGNGAQEITYEFIGSGTPSVAFDENLWNTRSILLSYFTDKGSFLALHGPDAITLANRSASPLKECRLIRKGVSTPIGPIGAGEKIQLNLTQDVNAAHSPPVLSGTRSGMGIFPRVVATYRSETNIGTMGDCVVCSLDESVAGLTSADTGLSYTGSTAVVFHLGTQSKGVNN